MIETRVQGASIMSGKRNKSGQKSPGHVVVSAENLAEKERADRIAAAEAMSCLSSVILLSSDLDKDANVASSAKGTPRGQKRSRNSQKSPQGTESKRGKSRSGRGRVARSANHQRGASSVRHSGNPQNVDNKVEVVTNDVRGVSRVGGGLVPSVGANKRFEGRALERVMPLPRVSRVAPIQPRSREGAVATPPTNSNQVVSSALQIAILSKLNASARDHRQTSGEQLVLKLPLVINNDNADGKSLTSPIAVVSPASVASTDSVEFTQSTVEKLLQPPNINKFDSLESALPLKKRKLLSYLHQSATTANEDSVSTVTSQALKYDQGGDVIDLTTVKVEPEHALRQQVIVPPSSAPAAPTAPTPPIVPVNATPVTSAATLNPVSVDPRTSLMLLTEMQMALQQDEDGDLPLHIAVAQENIVMVQKFVHLMSISGKSVDKYNKAQQTPLHLAVELDFVEAVKTLLLARANPNLVNKRGENAVHLAVKVQSTACLKFMIQHSQSHNKTDLNTRNFEGLAPLHTAVERNEVRIADMLLRAGADINILDGKSGKTPLFYSVEHNFLSMIEFLLSHGANVDLANYAGITVVMAAQARGYQEAATLLLKGMDSQAYELKESTPTKKIPIPRIPSKSHLIVNTESVNLSCPKNYKLTIQNSDSNSSESLSSLRPYQGLIAQRLAEEPMDVSHSTDMQNEINSENRLSGYRLINLVPTNLLNGVDQLADHMIPQSQSRHELTLSETQRQVYSNGAKQGYESKGSTPPPPPKTPCDVKHILSSEDVHPHRTLKSHDQIPQNQAVPPTSQAQPSQNQALPPTSQAPPLTSHAPPPTSQAPPPTSHAPPPTSHAPHLTSHAPPPTSKVQSQHNQASSSLQSSVRTLPFHHNIIHQKSPPDPQDNLHPGDSKQHPVENIPHKERHSHHRRETSVPFRDGSSHARDSSPHLNPINSAQNPMNSSQKSINISQNPMNSSFYPGSSFHSRDNSIQPRGNSPHQRGSSPHNKRIVKVNSSGKMHVERAGSGSKGQSSGSSKGSMPSSQMYHLTNISPSTASILAAKLQGIYTSKTGQASRPLNLSTGIPDSVNAKVKEET